MTSWTFVSGCWYITKMRSISAFYIEVVLAGVLKFVVEPFHFLAKMYLKLFVLGLVLVVQVNGFGIGRSEEMSLKKRLNHMRKEALMEATTSRDMTSIKVPGGF